MTATSRCLKYLRDPLMEFRNAFILICCLQLERHMILILASSPLFQRDIYKSINWQNSSAEQQLVEVPHSIKKFKLLQCRTYQITPDGTDKNNHRMGLCLIHMLSCIFFWMCKWISASPPNSQWKVTAEPGIYKSLFKEIHKQLFLWSFYWIL